jgi:hypothetical protein
MIEVTIFVESARVKSHCRENSNFISLEVTTAHGVTTFNLFQLPERVTDAILREYGDENTHEFFLPPAKPIEASPAPGPRDEFGRVGKQDVVAAFEVAS